MVQYVPSLAVFALYLAPQFGKTYRPMPPGYEGPPVEIKSLRIRERSYVETLRDIVALAFWCSHLLWLLLWRGVCLIAHTCYCLLRDLATVIYVCVVHWHTCVALCTWLGWRVWSGACAVAQLARHWAIAACCLYGGLIRLCANVIYVVFFTLGTLPTGAWINLLD